MPAVMNASSQPTILLVEDTPSQAQVYMEYLRREPYRVVHVDTTAAALDAVERIRPQLVLLDLRLPDGDGMDVLSRIADRGIPMAVIVITATGSVGLAVEAMRRGAYDFLVKPFTGERLIVTARNALKRLDLERLVDSYREDLGRSHYHGFIGSSHAMQAVYRIIDSVAISKATVFITGESGSGKEVCAEAIHRQSPRREQPFIALNCAAIPRDLLESEIFGHVRGAFTGAVNDRPGAAKMADAGTLFLDEICELDLSLQTKLLRFIQTGAYQRVGAAHPEKADIRIVCATNRDPLKEVAEGRFREDLFYRLHVIPLNLPPLRERGGDVVEIARHFLGEYAREENKRFARFSPEAEAAIGSHEWPGNVRQLQNVVRNAVVLHDGEVVTRAMLPLPVEPAQVARIAETPARAASVTRLVKPLWRIEKDAIEEAVASCGGNIPNAAQLLGISPSTIYRKRLAWDDERKAAS